MENSKQVDLLNQLIEINNDRLEGYDTASGETSDGDLKGLFTNLKNTSHGCLQELRSEVNSLGGKPEEGTRVTGKFFRAWMEVKSALTGGDRQTVLNSCEFGEDKAQEAYEDVLEHSADLSPGQLAMITAQKARLRADHDRVKALRDAQ